MKSVELTGNVLRQTRIKQIDSKFNQIKHAMKFP